MYVTDLVGDLVRVLAPEGLAGLQVNYHLALVAAVMQHNRVTLAPTMLNHNILRGQCGAMALQLPDGGQAHSSNILLIYLETIGLDADRPWLTSSRWDQRNARRRGSLTTPQARAHASGETKGLVSVGGWVGGWSSMSG